MDFNPYDLIDFLRQEGYEYKERGKELYFPFCPYCEIGREKKSEHFSFKKQTGQFFCVKCQVKGNLTTFKRDQGFEPFEHKVYHKPDQKRSKQLENQPKSYYDAYEETRGIPADTLQKYGIGKFKDDRLGQCRTYPYYQDGEIVNVKYVNSKKQMRTESNPRKTYFGIQFLDYEESELYVTEGEDDCMALVSMGYKNVVSVPYGAGNYSEEMGKINKKFKTIWLFFDNDEKGQKGAVLFSQKAGVWKCKNVLIPFKDVRECLVNGLDLFDMEKYKAKAKQFDYDPEVKVRPALSIDQRIDRYESDVRTNYEGIKLGYGIIDDVTGGLRGGDLLTIVANPGCFKTTTLMNFIKRSIDYTDDGIAIFFSLEMQIEAEFEREINIMFKERSSYNIRKGAHENSKEWSEFKSKAKKSKYSRIWVVEETWLSVEDMVKIIKLTEEVSGKKCIMCGVDYIDFVSTGKSKEYDAVKEVMMGLKKKVAKQLKIPVILLNQTNRENKQDSEEVGSRSGKGGTAIEATADFSIGVWREDTGLKGRITKHRRVMHGDANKQFPYLSFELSGLEILNIMEGSKPEKKNKGATAWWNKD